MKIDRVLIYVEILNDRPHPVCFELLTKTRQLFPDDSVSVAFAISGSRVDNMVEELRTSGIDMVYAMDDPRLELFNLDYACAGLLEAVKEYKPNLILIGATMFGEELAPTMGIKLDTGVAAHCMDIRKGSDGRLSHLVPAFGGKVIGEIFIPGDKPEISSIKPGIFQAEAMEPRESKVFMLDASILDQVKTKVEVLEVFNKEVSKGVPLDKADIVIAGGFGIGDKTNWSQMEELSIKLNGAVGCTRPAVDCGFTEDETNMIGTSGKSIRPKAYLGFGISGATHHLCGIKDSGLIISINSDENAEIFKSSDYYAVADSAEIINKLIEALR